MTLRKKLLLIAISGVYVLSMMGKWFWSVPGVVEARGEKAKMRNLLRIDIVAYSGFIHDVNGNIPYMKPHTTKKMG